MQKNIPFQEWSKPHAMCSLGTSHGSHTLTAMEFSSAFHYTYTSVTSRGFEGLFSFTLFHLGYGGKKAKTCRARSHFLSFCSLSKCFRVYLCHCTFGAACITTGQCENVAVIISISPGSQLLYLILSITYHLYLKRRIYEK